MGSIHILGEHHACMVLGGRCCCCLLSGWCREWWGAGGASGHAGDLPLAACRLLMGMYCREGSIVLAEPGEDCRCTER